MLKSMTGFGSSTVIRDDFALTLELKSVNHRFLKLNGRVSDEFSFLQIELDEIFRKGVDRGSLFYTAVVEPTRPADLYEIDLQVLEKYLNTFVENEKRLPMSSGRLPEAKDLLLLPGVVRAEETLKLQNGVSGNGARTGISKEELTAAARQAAGEALAELVKMRKQEGQFLGVEFRRRCQSIRERLSNVKQAIPDVVSEHNRRMLERVNQLLDESNAKAKPEDLVREVAIIAERADINEELERMESHLEQFSENIDQPSPVGRKLEFIVQEMFRESNTLSAKVTGASLTRDIVELKADVDRLKEQVLNIE